MACGREGAPGEPRPPTERRFEADRREEQTGAPPRTADSVGEAGTPITRTRQATRSNSVGELRTEEALGHVDRSQGEGSRTQGCVGGPSALALRTRLSTFLLSLRQSNLERVT